MKAEVLSVGRWDENIAISIRFADISEPNVYYNTTCYFDTRTAKLRVGCQQHSIQSRFWNAPARWIRTTFGRRWGAFVRQGCLELVCEEIIKLLEKGEGKQ